MASSGLHEHPPTLDPRGVHGRAHLRIIEATPGREVELPAVPRAAEDGASRELVPSRRPGLPLPDAAEAEWAAVMRAAVADAVEGARARFADDAHLASADAGDDTALPHELLDGADVDPPAHERMRPSRSP
jgi:hypothetical protein